MENLSQKIKAIIYDLDDLMANSDPLHAKAWEILLNSLEYSFNNLPKKLKSKFIGMRVIDILEEIIKYLNLNESKEKLYKKRIDTFLNLVKEKLEPMPGLFQSIKLFKENKLKLAIASSGTREYINLVLSKFKLKNVFDIIVSGDDVKIGKPNPETYIITCRKLNLQPKECLVLEDATVGIESAKKAGCRCMAVRNPNTPFQNLSKADVIVDNLSEISLETIKYLSN